MDIQSSSDSYPSARILATCGVAPNKQPGLNHKPSRDFAAPTACKLEAKSESNLSFTFQTLFDQSACTSSQPSSITYALNGGLPRFRTSSSFTFATLVANFSLLTLFP